MEIIKIVIGVLSFALGWCIWIKVVDRTDEFVKRKLSEKNYNRITCTLFIIIFGAIIYSIVAR